MTPLEEELLIARWDEDDDVTAGLAVGDGQWEQSEVHITASEPHREAGSDGEAALQVN